MKTSAERQAIVAKRKREQGLVQVASWVPAKHKLYLLAVAGALRHGTKLPPFQDSLDIFFIDSPAEPSPPAAKPARRKAKATAPAASSDPRQGDLIAVITAKPVPERQPPERQPPVRKTKPVRVKPEPDRDSPAPPPPPTPPPSPPASEPAATATDPRTRYGQRLQAARKARNWSQRELAARVSGSAGQIQAAEKGIRLPPPGIAKAIARILGVKP